MGIWYRTGTVTVTNGSASVTGITTGWTDATVKDVDALYVPASSDYPGEILTVNSATSITLANNWHGTSQASVPYFIIRGTSWGDVTRLAVQISELIANQVDILSGAGVPSNSLGGDGSVYFRDDAPEYYAKTGGAWGSPISLTGPAGPAGPSYVGTSTTSRTIGTGSMTFTTQAGLAYAIGTRLRFTSAANPTTHYMEGVVTAYSTTTLTATMDKFAGSGARADWNIGLAGDVGSTGPAGPGYFATSTASLLIGTGSKAFTGVGTSLGYSAGMRAIASSLANSANYMEGRVTSYSGGTLTLNVNLTGGSGTFADWQINIAGEQGPQGIQGPQGVAGPTGATGASYAGTSTTSLSIGTGSKVFTTQAGLAYVVGASRARASDSSGANYVEGLVTAYSGTSLTISADRAVGSGTITAWNISLAGDAGANGASGSVLTATSTTSLTPSIGSNVFTVAAGLSFQAGNRVRGASAAAPTTNWFSGVVSSYSSTTLTITVDKLGTPASAADWNIAISGEPGVDGAGTVNSVNGQTGTVVLAATDIEVPYTPTKYTPAGNSVNDHIAAIDGALGSGNYALTTIASAATVDIGAAATDNVLITGTTTITSFGTVVNKRRLVRFNAALTLTHNATTLILPGGINITTYDGLVIELVSDASGNWRCISFLAKRPTVQRFTASGTWTKPAGCRGIKVTTTGGGGAGGGANTTAASQSSAGAGGAGGGTSIKWIDVTAISSVSVTIGAGGTPSAGANGGAGGTTSFGAHCSATGGTGGTVNGATGTVSPAGTSGTGGIGSSGDVNFTGSGGTSGFRAGGGTGLGGSGGSSFFGGGGGTVVSATADGLDAGVYGSGGGGACNGQSQGSAKSGGAGSAGIVVVEEFY